MGLTPEQEQVRDKLSRSYAAVLVAEVRDKTCSVMMDVYDRSQLDDPYERPRFRFRVAPSGFKQTIGQEPVA